MPTPLQTVITLPLYGHSYTYMQSKCPKEWEEWESPRWKKTNSATLRENLTFKLNSVTESVDPQISAQQHLKNAV